MPEAELRGFQECQLTLPLPLETGHNTLPVSACVTMHVLICMCQHVCVNMYVPTCMCQHVCVTMYVPTCMCQYVCVYMYVPTCANMYVSTCMCQDVCVSMYVSPCMEYAQPGMLIWASMPSILSGASERIDTINQQIDDHVTEVSLLFQ